MKSSSKNPQNVGVSEKYSPEQLREMRRIQRLQTIRDLLPLVLKAGILTFLILELSITIRSFAGKSSFAYLDFALKFIADLRMDEWFAYLFGLVFGGGGTFWGMKERKEKKRKVEYLTNRLTKLENKFDQDRSSSELDPTGDTKIGD